MGRAISGQSTNGHLALSAGKASIGLWLMLNVGSLIALVVTFASLDVMTTPANF